MKRKPTNLKEIIEYAIAKEKVAHALYLNASKEASLPSNRQLLTKLAEMEAAHAEKLEKLDPTGLTTLSSKLAEDLHIAEFLEDVELDANADFQSILIYAMKREEKSRDFYETMSKVCEDEKAKKLFAALADEEKEHKRSLELIYDEEILRED